MRYYKALRYCTLASHLRAVPGPTKKDVERWVKGLKDRPPHLRSNEKRLEQGLKRLKAKWNKGDERDTSNDK